jgi:opacity protein-like surface antigen
MTRRLICAIAILSFCFLLSNNAWAQFSDYSELNLFGAGSIYDTNHFQLGFPQSAVPIPGQLKFNSQFRTGVRFGMYMHGHWGEEVFYSYEPNTMTIIQGATTKDFHVQINNYGVNALYYLAETEEHSILPFVSAGIGGTFYRVRPESLAFARDPAGGNYPDMNNANELAFNFGAGIKTHSKGWFGVRADVRDFIGRSPSFGIPRNSINPTAIVLPAGGALNNFEGSVGVIFYFGRQLR